MAIGVRTDLEHGEEGDAEAREVVDAIDLSVHVELHVNEYEWQGGEVVEWWWWGGVVEWWWRGGVVGWWRRAGW